MPKRQYPDELVAQVHRFTADGASVREAARALDVPRSTVTAILKQHQPPALIPIATVSPVPTIPPLPPQPRLLLHPWLCEPAWLPNEVACHPTVRALYADAFNGNPVRASELDILRVAFELPVPPVRAYLNVLAAERLRARFDLIEDDDPSADDPTIHASTRLTLPRLLWAAALEHLRAAFAHQEYQMGVTRDRLLRALPRESALNET